VYCMALYAFTCSAKFLATKKNFSELVKAHTATNPTLRNATHHPYIQTVRAAEPEPKQFWTAGAGAKIFNMMEPEPEI